MSKYPLQELRSTADDKPASSSPSRLTLSDSPTRDASVVARRGPDDVTILLDTESGEYFTLDEVGGRIWELCDGSRTVAQIADVISSEYEAPDEQIRTDLLDLLRELNATGLLRA